MFSYWAPPASAPLPRRTARSMLSFGTELFLAFWIASYSVGLPPGSPPPTRAATSTFLISLANSLPRLASMTAFLCFVVAHLEWPLISRSSIGPGLVPRPAQLSSLPARAASTRARSCDLLLHDLHEQRVHPRVAGQLRMKRGGQQAALSHRHDPTGGGTCLDRAQHLDVR